MSKPVIKVIKAGYGYWETDRYPIGGCFRRAPSGGEGIVEVLRTFPIYRGVSEEGRTDDGRKIAYDPGNTVSLVDADKVADAGGHPGDVAPGYDRSDWRA